MGFHRKSGKSERIFSYETKNSLGFPRKPLRFPRFPKGTLSLEKRLTPSRNLLDFPDFRLETQAYLLHNWKFSRISQVSVVNSDFRKSGNLSLDFHRKSGKSERIFSSLGFPRKPSQISEGKSEFRETIDAISKSLGFPRFPIGNPTIPSP